jgi:tRNA-splicing endonuclease subunit Sen34
MDQPPGGSGPPLPFPIFRLSSNEDQYMLYDVEIVSWLRREHRILGCLGGTLPLIPQQNVFLGLPQQLMPEEALLLTEKGLAFIVDDASRHRDLTFSSEPGEQSFKAMLQAQGREAAAAALRRKKASREHAMQKTSAIRSRKTADAEDSTQRSEADEEASEFLFQESGPISRVSSNTESSLASVPETWHVTPTTSFFLLPSPDIHTARPSPRVSGPSFAVFKHLNERGYYLSPGLRFGCQFMAYPGDPLRYHSHFLAVGADWDEEIDFLDVVGCGRLGTGVKKGFLLGGTQPSAEKAAVTRAFCIEWGGM